MKKFLIILTFLFSTMFFIHNVNAQSIDVKKVKFDSNNIDEKLKKYEIINTYTYSGITYNIYSAEDYDGYKGFCFKDICFLSSDIKYYVFWYYNTTFHIAYNSDVMYNSSDNYGKLYSFYNNSYTDNVNAFDFYCDYDFKRDEELTGRSITWDFSNVKSWNQIYANFDIVNYNNSNIYLEKNIDYFSTPSKPTISITKESETTVTVEDETFISSVTLNIEFSNIDNDKYLYMYKYGSSNDWSTISLTQSNSFNKTFNTNNTLYVQILDKTTHDIVTSATFTINQINYNFEPYVDVTEKIPTACSFYKNGRSYTICKDINLSAKNLEDGNYISSYSYDKINWTNFVNTTISMNENKTIYFKIYNYLTNEVSYTSSYTVSNIDTDISELGVFNTYSSSYDKNTSLITAYINIYNLLDPVQDNYKIYYSFNSTSFNDITLLLSNKTNYYQYEINNINEDTTIYFKITDLNDNILYTSTYSINYQIEANENSNFFSSFRTKFHGLSDIITTPLYAIKKINTGVCSPLEIPIPFTNKNISLPCMNTVYENNIPNILNIWQIVTNGIISYFIILDLFRIVKSFKSPEEDKIEVVDL